MIVVGDMKLVVGMWDVGCGMMNAEGTICFFPNDMVK